MKPSKDKSIYEEIVKASVAQKKYSAGLDLAKAIKDLRESKKLSGVSLCRKSGDLDPKTLTAVEKGRIRNPSIQTLQAIARGLGVSISDLFRKAESALEENFFTGSQKGAFQMDLPKLGIRVVSFTPLKSSFFYGKLILASKKKLDNQSLRHPYSIFISPLMGRFEIAIENTKMVLKEGENVFFNGAFRHSISNLQQRESVLLMATAPSFL